MCHFCRFFGLFSKSRIEILLLKRQNVEEMDSEQMQKTVRLILFKKSRYITILHVSGGYISRNVNIIVRDGVSSKVRENGSNDFPETLHVVRYQKVKKCDTAGFLKKKLDHPISTKMWSKLWFLAIFSSFKFFKFFYIVNLDSRD